MNFLAELYEGLRKAVITRHYGSEAAMTERWQAVVRLWFGGTAALYLVVSAALGALPEQNKSAVLAYIAYYLIIVLVVYAAICRWPAPNPWRRIFSLVNDYASMTFVLLMGGETAVPVAVILLWVAIGTGVRYGSRYLIAANILALLSIIATFFVVPYWGQNPYLFAAMLLLLILTPSYAQLLVNEARLAHEAALQANLAKSRFLAQASHDLRQPIHAIGLFTACLRDTRLDDDQRQMVSNIDRSLHSVSRLFRSLLDISTLDSGKLRPRREVVSMGELLRDLMEQNTEAARWADVEMRVVPTKLCFVADPGLMTTIVQNLLSNAFKYAPRGRVIVGCRRRKDTYSLLVCDEGEGIAPENQDRVFEEFYRVVQVGTDIEGVGLGLPIVRRMADLMGFSVSLRSLPGAGTVVSIDGLIPILEKTITTSVVQRPASRTLLTGIRILLIEDDFEVLLATRTLLENWGCIVRAEKAAPDVFHESDVIITDFDLNGSRTGADCIREIRESLGREVPAVVMTGHDQGQVISSLGDPAVPVLSKPVRPSELRAVLMAYALSNANGDQ